MEEIKGIRVIQLELDNIPPLELIRFFFCFSFNFLLSNLTHLYKYGYHDLKEVQGHPYDNDE